MGAADWHRVQATAEARCGVAGIVERRDRERTMTLQGQLNPGYTATEVNADFIPWLAESSEAWRSGYKYEIGGESETSEEANASIVAKLPLAGMMMIVLLVFQFNSVRRPIIILLTIPLALIGTFLGSFLAWIPFSFTTFIGVIALVGIVVNDAIVMVDTMNSYQAEGMTVRRAAANGVSDRLRPIITTSVTTILGLIPLAFSDPTWMPLCSAIIFGLIAATLIALVVVPCLYLQFTPKTENPEVSAA